MYECLGYVIRERGDPPDSGRLVTEPMVAYRSFSNNVSVGENYYGTFENQILGEQIFWKGGDILRRIGVVIIGLLFSITLICHYHLSLSALTDKPLNTPHIWPPKDHLKICWGEDLL